MDIRNKINPENILERARDYRLLIDKTVGKPLEGYSKDRDVQVVSKSGLIEAIASWKHYLLSEKRFSENTVSAYLLDLSLFLACIRVTYEQKSWQGPQRKIITLSTNECSATFMENFCEFISLDILSKLDREDILNYTLYRVEANKARQSAGKSFKTALPSAKTPNKQGYARTSTIRANSALRGFFKHLQKEQEYVSNNLSRDLNELENRLNKTPKTKADWQKLSVNRDDLIDQLKRSNELLNGFKKFNLGQTKSHKILPKPIPVNKWEELLSIAENWKYDNKTQPLPWVIKRNVAILFLLYGCGLRISEALSLKWVDVDGKDTLLIKGKGDKTRPVPILPLVKQKINEYRHAYQKHTRTELNLNQQIFFGVRGKPLSPRSVQDLMVRLRDTLNQPPSLTPHALRHSFATHIYNSSKDLRAIADLLGHKSLETTIHYTAIDDEEIKTTHKNTHPLNKKKIVWDEDSGQFTLTEPCDDAN